MKKKLKIDIVSDVVYPWCTIGYKRLEKAIEELGVEDKIEIEWQPFELNPQMPAKGQNVIEHIAEKYGSSIEEQKQSQERLTEFGAELGFKFDYFDEMRIVNTREAHILLDYAQEEGKQTELNVHFVTAFFSERKDISKREILLQEIESVGLDKTEALKRLENKEALDKIIAKEQFWQSRGISSVPTMVFNSTSALRGAQPVDVYKQVLTQLLSEKEN
ncbi:Predicted dithiol-disulfide isomerase, DsbA family [Lutibacter oricola]|uniref:Predicted dithiol-disulfide isomerase, DsbA family n=1 Tax=Lutibacter oricola TaxID=762486 RepID=A0A1H2QRJ1_9FLAO|nr:DsbA family oxidoreductase [Lutibacter oricola]SDW09761.1 Predicted dithiol-disulfide isomerase, DsbA family [Lutibacter oricola]